MDIEKERLALIALERNRARVPTIIGSRDDPKQKLLEQKQSEKKRIGKIRDKYLAKKAYLKKYYREHRKKLMERQREYNKRIIVSREKAEQIMAQRRERAILRKSAMDELGGKCRRCGFNDSRAIQIDHIKGDGKSDRKNIIERYKRIILGMDKDRYQLLCCNCNRIKMFENGEWVSPEIIIKD